MCVCVVEARSIGFLGAGVKGCCGFPDMDARNCMHQVLWKNSK